ncbi:glycine betaine ABC transporter substrate-binding protein [Nocardioides sp.]|uniref:taurine ABC transporter substrate-binding protein n=1 Tax=Nocardioides sp. TaxID=35761 RepID=UPI0039E6CC23
MSPRIGSRTGLVAVLAGSLLALTACGSDSDGDSAGDSATASGLPETIRIGYQLIPNGDLVVKNQGLLEEAFGDDVKIEWNQFASGGDVNQAILGGSIDIGLAGSSPVARGLSSGIPYEVPFIFDVIGTAEALVAKPGITDVADLKGKTVATPLASTSHYSLLAALADAGLSASDVNVIDSEPDAILAAWQAGQIDAAYVWNPVLAELEKDGTVLTDSSQLAAEGKTTYDLAVVTTEFAEKYPDAVQTWIQQEDAAVKALNAGDEAAFQSLAAELNLSADEVKAQTAGLIFVDAATQTGEDYLGGGLPDNLYATAQFNQELGQIDTVADEQDYRDAVVATFAAAVK